MQAGLAQLGAGWRAPALRRVRKGQVCEMIVDMVRRYYEFRGLKVPSTEEAFLFLASEMGELADEIVSSRGGWVRNNEGHTGEKVADEIGDTLMMLTILADSLGIDPVHAMITKMQKKGFV